MTLRTCLPLLVIGALALSGCIEKRKPAETGTPAPKPGAVQKTDTPPPAARPAAPSGNYLSNLTDARNRAAGTADLASLNSAVQQFGATEGRLPHSLGELVAQKYLKAIPVSPPGQRIVYNAEKGEVTLVPDR